MKELHRLAVVHLCQNNTLSFLIRLLCDHGNKGGFVICK